MGRSGGHAPRIHRAAPLAGSRPDPSAACGGCRCLPSSRSPARSPSAPPIPRLVRVRAPMHVPPQNTPMYDKGNNRNSGAVDEAFWLGFSEIYHWPCVTSFSSWADLMTKLDAADFQATHNCMVQVCNGAHAPHTARAAHAQGRVFIPPTVFNPHHHRPTSGADSKRSKIGAGSLGACRRRRAATACHRLLTRMPTSRASLRRYPNRVSTSGALFDKISRLPVSPTPATRDIHDQALWWAVNRKPKSRPVRARILIPNPLLSAGAGGRRRTASGDDGGVGRTSNCRHNSPPSQTAPRSNKGTIPGASPIINKHHNP